MSYVEQVDLDRINALIAKRALLKEQERVAYTEFKRREKLIALEPAREEWLKIYGEIKHLSDLIEALGGQR